MDAADLFYGSLLELPPSAPATKAEPLRWVNGSTETQANHAPNQSEK